MPLSQELVITDVIASLNPFHLISEDDLILIVNEITVHDIAKGQVLFKAGDTDDWDFYLHEGKLELVASDGKQSILEGGTDNAKNPVSHLRPRMYSATSLTSVVYFKIKHSCVDDYLRQDHDTTREVNDDVLVGVLMGNPLFREIYQDLNADNLSLPALPDIALRIQKAMENDDINIEQVAKVIQQDPAATAKLIKVANSAFYRTDKSVESCAAAIVRMGMNTAKNIVISLVLRNLFHTVSPVLKKYMEELWQHSTKVAAIAFVLARKMPEFNPDQALLAGLLHDIGVLIIIGYAEGYSDLSSDADELEKLIRYLRSQVGGMVLRQWGFSDELVVSAEQAEDWYRNESDTLDYCDIVLIAQLYSFVDMPKINDVPAIHEVPAYQKMSLGQLNPEMGIQILQEANDEIEEMRKLLN